jgi:hypothetical protein
MLRATTLELHIGREPVLELAHHRHEADHLYGHILMIVRRITQMEDAAGIILAVYEGMATKFLHQSLLAFQTDRQCREPCLNDLQRCAPPGALWSRRATPEAQMVAVLQSSVPLWQFASLQGAEQHPLLDATIGGAEISWCSLRKRTPLR